MVWFTNLKLLGYKEVKFTMFDHSNPSGFQQTFHYLLQLIHKDKSSQEFRDCWPILDKKQEADFRRRVASMIKDLQKDYPDELPYCNPSLFQQPGGRKFLSFLSKFSTFVLKCLVRSDDLLRKTSPRLKIMKKVCFKNLVNKTERIYDDAANDQEEIRDIESEAVETVGTILEKFEQHRLNLEELPADDATTPEDPDLSGKKDQLLEMEERAKKVLQSVGESLDTINFVVEGGVDKIKLDFDELDGVHGDGNSLATVYQALIKSVLTTAELTCAKKTPITIDHNCNVETERQKLTQLRNDLEKSYGETKELVDDLQASSIAIDWSQSSLVRRTKAEVSVKLLPPTPSIVSNIRSREPGLGADPCRHLSLASPDPRLLTPRPGLRPGLAPTATVTPVRSAPSATLFRRFPITQATAESPQGDRLNFNSPQLKPKSPNLTTQSQDLNFSCRTTKGSLGQFSPMLSSTAAVSEERPVTPTFSDLGDLTSRGNTPTFSELADNSSRMSHFDTTQSKIEMYRKVLDGLKTSSVSQDKSALLSAWTAHRESLSPRNPKLRRSRSPRFDQEPKTPTPGTPVTVKKGMNLEEPSMVNPIINKSPLNDLVISRLDQLMTSLTLNENHNGLNLSLDDEMDLLSPHL